jgi:dolichol-phosphate mannosyltransferase
MQELATTWPIGSPTMRVLVMLPTYNEIENIQDVLERVRAALPEADILVIDDGSPDGTADRAEKLGEVLGGIDVLRRASKSGLGSAYRAGFRVGLARGYDVMIEMDADLSHDPAVLPELVGAVEEGADVAIGSRYVPGGSIPDWKWLRRAISRGGGPTPAPCSASRCTTPPPGSAPTTGATSRRSTSTAFAPTATASRWR